jgi:hypothetical protein
MEKLNHTSQKSFHSIYQAPQIEFSRNVTVKGSNL